MSEDSITPRASAEGEPAKRDETAASKSEAPSQDEHAVGYRRPPKHTRFQSGKSGNDCGRPPGVKSLGDIVRKIVGQKVTITENGRSRRVPRLEAVLLRAASEAARGDAPALRLLLSLTERYGEAPSAGADRETTTAEDLAILKRYLPNLEASDSVEAQPEPNAEGSNEL